MGFGGVGLHHQVRSAGRPRADGEVDRACPPIRPPKSDPAQRRINGSSPRRHGRRSQAHRPLLPRCRWRSPRPGSRTSTLRLPDVMVDDHRLTGRCFQDADGDLRDQARERPRFVSPTSWSTITGSPAAASKMPMAISATRLANVHASSPRRHGRRSQAHRPLLPRCRWRSPRPGSRTSTLTSAASRAAHAASPAR